MNRLNKIVFVLCLVLPSAMHSQNEWVLQPWLQVIGRLGQGLGSNVASIKPRPNLPYKAMITDVRGVGFYSLQNQNDSLPKKMFSGYNAVSGDLNGDGYTDLVFSRYINGYDTVFVFWGNSTGIDTLNPLIIPNEHQYDGLSVGCIGDVDNDGKLDLVLLAPGYSRNRGKVYVFLGPNITSIPNATILGESEFARLGIRCALGDLNGDGLNELVIRGNDNRQNVPSQNLKDYVNIYYCGRAGQLDLRLGAKLVGYRETTTGMAVFDVNGDGLADVLWTSGDPKTGYAVIYVHLGRRLMNEFKTTPDFFLRPPAFSGIDFDIVNAGDMNGDGYNDVIVGGAGFQNVYHFVIVYSGGPNMDGNFDAAVGTDNESYFGWSIAAIGDVNGDGLADILVGAPNYGRFGLNENKGYWGIFLGDRRIPVFTMSEAPPTPTAFKLNQNYPNPFNSSTIITYSLPTQSHVTIRLFDILGKDVGKIVDGERSAGDYFYRFDAKSFATGSYVYRMEVINENGSLFTDVKRMLLIR